MSSELVKCEVEVMLLYTSEFGDVYKCILNGTYEKDITVTDTDCYTYRSHSKDVIYRKLIEELVSIGFPENKINIRIL